MTRKKRIVIALGGNALGNTLPEQMAALFMESACFSGDNNSIPHSIRIFSEKISHDVKTCAIICEIIKNRRI